MCPLCDHAYSAHKSGKGCTAKGCDCGETVFPPARPRPITEPPFPGAR